MKASPVYRYRAEVLTVIDADTLRLRVDLGFRCATTIEGRVRGVNAPELRTPEGERARAFVIALVSGREVVVESDRDRRSFARWVVDVWLSDGQALGDALVTAGYGERVPR